MEYRSIPSRVGTAMGSLRLNVGVVDLLAVIIPFQDDIALCKGFFQVAFFNADVGDHIVLGLFVHQPAPGASASSGVKMPGISSYSALISLAAASACSWVSANTAAMGSA